MTSFRKNGLLLLFFLALAAQAVQGALPHFRQFSEFSTEAKEASDQDLSSRRKINEVVRSWQPEGVASHTETFLTDLVNKVLSSSSLSGLSKDRKNIPVWVSPDSDITTSDGGIITISGRDILNFEFDDEIAFVTLHELSHLLLLHNCQLHNLKIKENISSNQDERVLATQRKTELEADALAIRLLNENGFCENSALSVFAKWKHLYGEGNDYENIPTIFRTHPSLQSRIEAAQNLISKMPNSAECIPRKKNISDAKGEVRHFLDFQDKVRRKEAKWEDFRPYIQLPANSLFNSEKSTLTH